MDHHHLPPGDSDGSRYEIRLSGRLAAHWTHWFDGLSVRDVGDGTTVISGPVADQAALHGLLTRVRDLGLPLLSVNQLEPGLKGPSTNDKRGEPA